MKRMKKGSKSVKVHKYTNYVSAYKNEKSK